MILFKVSLSKVSFAQRIFVGFGLIIALLIIIIVSAYSLFFSLLHTNQLVAHTQEVRTELSGLLSAVEEAETGQRGYLLTGDALYLQPYHQAQKSVEARLLRLTRLTADNAEQQRQIPLLQQATRSKLNEIQQTLQLYDQHRYAEAQRTVRTDQGRREMEAIRQIIAQMRLLENGLLQQRTQTVSAFAARTLLALTVLVGLISAFLLATFHLMRCYIWERRQAEAALRRLVTVQEDERRRISRELHDEMGQYLTALMLGLDAVVTGIQDASPLREQIQQLQQVSRQVGQDIHRIAWELRPTALDDMGLEVALRNYLEEWSERVEIVADFHKSGQDFDRLPPEIETTLYRVIQEALNNIVKHAHAERVSLILERQAGHVSVIIEDNGVGIDTAELAKTDKTRRSMGLIGIKERVSMVGGAFTLESAPGQGTTLFVRIPIAAPVTNRESLVSLLHSSLHEKAVTHV